jgi:mannose-6-phosphate isomerase
MFDYTEYPLETIGQTLIQSPDILRETEAFKEERVIDLKHQEFFRLRRLSGSGAADWQGGEPMILIMLEGSGELDGYPVAAGETWLLPGSAAGWNWTGLSKHWNFLLAQPPVR